MEFTFVLSLVVFTIQINSCKNNNFNKIIFSVGFIIFLVGLTFLFEMLGELRMKDNLEFSISEYGQMRSTNKTIAWFFGYILAGYHNLALVIDSKFSNGFHFNWAGPLLHVLKIREYTEIDDYPYIGRFNLGTGFRSFVIDYGPFFGLCFGVMSIFPFIFLIKKIKTLSLKISGILLFVVCLFQTIITDRFYNPPFLFIFASIILLDILARKKISIN